LLTASQHGRAFLKNLLSMNLHELFSQFRYINLGVFDRTVHNSMTDCLLDHNIQKL